MTVSNRAAKRQKHPSLLYSSHLHLHRQLRGRRLTCPTPEASRGLVPRCMRHGTTPGLAFPLPSPVGPHRQGVWRAPNRHFREMRWRLVCDSGVWDRQGANKIHYWLQMKTLFVFCYICPHAYQRHITRTGSWRICHIIHYIWQRPYECLVLNWTCRGMCLTFEKQKQKMWLLCESHLAKIFYRVWRRTLCWKNRRLHQWYNMIEVHKKLRV